ncbi:MAG: hypothetical protein WDN75_17740 [Bacteroidota bacterium]
MAWFNISKLPKLAFDHEHIVDIAIKRLQGKLTYEPIGFELLDKKFPFSDLKKFYQSLLDHDLDRRNFKKKIISHGFLDSTKRSISSSKRTGIILIFSFEEKVS